MKTLAISSSRSRPYSSGYPEVSLRFEWLVVLSSLWLFAGLYLDGWAHNNIPDQIDSFFTPWHAVLYSGYAVSAAILGVIYILNIRRGYGWLQALPPAYMTALLGAVIFAVAGNLDFIWHWLFGFEEDVEALVMTEKLLFGFAERLVRDDGVIPMRQNTMWFEIDKGLLFTRNMIASFILFSIQISTTA